MPASVFASRVQEEKTTRNHRHINNGMYGGIGRIVGRNAEGVVQQLDGYRFDNLVRRRVGLGIGVQLALDTEVAGTERVFPHVPGPPSWRTSVPRNV